MPFLRATWHLVPGRLYSTQDCNSRRISYGMMRVALYFFGPQHRERVSHEIQTTRTDTKQLHIYEGMPVWHTRGYPGTHCIPVRTYTRAGLSWIPWKSRKLTPFFGRYIVKFCTRCSMSPCQLVNERLSLLFFFLSPDIWSFFFRFWYLDLTTPLNSRRKKKIFR